MLCLIPFCEHDRDHAIALIEWIRHLGGWGKHRLLTVAVPELKLDGIENIGDYERVRTDWSNGRKDASGVNSLFRQAAYWVYMNDRQPWLWNEPDAIWLRGGVLDTLEAEYTTAGKPYMGATRFDAKGRKHVDGVAVYPPNVTEIGTRILLADRSPFDQIGGDEVLKDTHITKLIAHKYEHKEVDSLEKLQPVIDSGAVLFHSKHKHGVLGLLGGTKYQQQEEELKMEPIAATDSARVVAAKVNDALDLDSAIKILKSEANRSPLHKARLTKSLVAAGVIAEQKKPTGRPRPKSPARLAGSH